MQVFDKLSVPGRNLVKLAKGDRYIWSCAILLSIISMLVVYSATGSLAYKMNHGNTETYLLKQIFFIGLGLCFIFLIHRLNYALFSRISLLFYIFSLILLMYTLFFGAEINDGSRWIRVPVINLTIQSSDVGKLALYMFISRQLSRTQDKVNDFKHGYLPLIIPIVLTCGLILPANLSNAALTFATSLMLLFIGRVRLKFLLGTIGCALIPVIILILTAVTTYHKADPNIDATTTTENTGGGLFKRAATWNSRVQHFLYHDGSEDKDGDYQANQAKIAIANGSLMYGLGPGNSQQRNFLPQAYNDFIYSIIIEEYGLIGGFFILFIYLFFLYRCIRIFRRCPFAFGAFLALALSFTLVIQALANMMVNVNLMPVTGVTLPLISMGGSSYLFTCISIGIILSVSRNVDILEGKRARNIEKMVAKEELQGVPISSAAMQAELEGEN